jgi:tetratricopeptide (TPR) repeat protein
MTTSAAPSPAARYRARLRRQQGQLWQVPTFVAGLLALALVATGASVPHDSSTPADRTLAAARAALKDRSGQPEHVYSLAQKALAYAGDSAPAKAEAHLLLGLAAERLAAKALPPRAAELRQEALTHFTQAENLGLAESDQPRLAFCLGRLLSKTQGDPQQVVSYLKRGLPRGTDNPVEGYGLLAQAYLRLPTPDVEAALQANQQQLDLGGDGKTLAAVRLTRGEILIQLGQYPEAAKVLERIGPAAAADVRRRASYFLAQAYEKTGQWGKAVPLWQELLKTPEQIPDGKARALYTLGLCLLQAAPPNAEAARSAWQQALAEGGEPAQAAAFRLAELDLAGPTPDLARVLDELKGAVDKVQQPREYQNKLLELERAREIFESALRTAQENQAFEQAQQLADLYRHLAPPGTAEERFAVAAEGWARQLDEKAAHSTGSEANTAQAQAQAQWCTAGVAAERAATARGGSQPELLWQAGQDYRRGQDNDKAAAVLNQLVHLKLPPDRLAECWLSLAEAHEALEQQDEARQAYLECIKFSTSPASYRARLQLALDMKGKGQADEAVRILQQNLEIIDPSRDRSTYEHSLYALGMLLFEQGHVDKAWVHLKQAAREYPDNREALASRDRLGQCYRQLAEREGQKLKELADPVNRNRPDRETAQAHYERQRQKWLGEAEDTYQKLKDDLNARAAGRALTEPENKLLRRAAFAVADIDLEANHFSEALRLYLDLAEAHVHQMESLLACQGIRCCWNNLIHSSPDRAHEALPRVQAVIRQVQAGMTAIPDAAFPMDAPRAAWQDFFTRFLQHLEKVAASPQGGV